MEGISINLTIETLTGYKNRIVKINPNCYIECLKEQIRQSERIPTDQ